MRLRKTLVGVTVLALMSVNVSMFSNLDASADAIGQAWLLMMSGGGDNITGVANFNVSDLAGYIDITGNGSYTISFDIPEGCGAEQIDFLGISTNINMYYQDDNEVEIYKDMTFDISSIVIDGVEIDYTKSDNADGTNDDDVTYRLSIYDTWSGRDVQDIDNVVSCAENITINFDISGIATDDVSYSGSCGEDCTYSFDETTGTLTISGEGDMYDYESSTDVPWYSFREDIKSVIIEDSQCGVTSIGNWSFAYCTSLESVTIPDNVTNIGMCAFESCTSLAGVTIPNNFTTIDIGAFEKCTSLTEVTIPYYVTSISSRAFFGCDSLANIYYNGTEEEWNSIDVYDYNDSLTSATIHYRCCGENCTYSFDETTGTLTISGTGDMEHYPLYSFGIPWDSYREDIKSVIIEDGVTSISAFEYCTSLTEVIIPDSVTTIGEGAFHYCTSLTEVIIPDSVTSIGDMAFGDCASLTEVTIPNSVTSIGEWAFGYYCDDMYSGSTMEGFTIYGVSGSEAETYATENGFTFIETTDDSSEDPYAYCIFDVNQDGEVKTNDLLLLKKRLLGLI